MIELIKNLKHHFKDRLQKIEWLDNHTKSTAREVLSTSLYEIVTAAEISQIIEREGIYNNVSIRGTLHLIKYALTSKWCI